MVVTIIKQCYLVLEVNESTTMNIHLANVSIRNISDPEWSITACTHVHGWLIGTLISYIRRNTRLGYQLGLFPNEHNYSKRESANRS